MFVCYFEENLHNVLTRTVNIAWLLTNGLCPTHVLLDFEGVDRYLLQTLYYVLSVSCAF